MKAHAKLAVSTLVALGACGPSDDGMLVDRHDDGSDRLPRWQEFALAQVVDGPLSVDLERTEFEGTGCSARDMFDVSFVSSEWADVRSLFVEYLDYTLDTMKTRTYQIKECKLGIPVAAKPGYQFAVRAVRFDGTADLEEDVSMEFWGSYKLDSTALALALYTDRKGPFGFYRPDRLPGKWLVRDPTRSTVWSPCGGTAKVVLDTTLILRNSTGSRKGTASLNTSAVQIEDSGITVNVEVQKCTE